MQICAGAGMGWQETDKHPDTDIDQPSDTAPQSHFAMWDLVPRN